MKRLWEIEVIDLGQLKPRPRLFFTEAATKTEARNLVNLNYPFPHGAKIIVRQIA